MRRRGASANRRREPLAGRLDRRRSQRLDAEAVRIVGQRSRAPAALVGGEPAGAAVRATVGAGWRALTVKTYCGQVMYVVLNYNLGSDGLYD